MGLEGLPRTITVKTPTFVEPDEVTMFDDRWEPRSSPVKQGIGQRGIFNQDALIVSDPLSNYATHSSYLVGQPFAPTNQCRTLVLRQKVMQKKYSSRIELFLSHECFPCVVPHLRVPTIDDNRTADCRIVKRCLVSLIEEDTDGRTSIPVFYSA